MKATEKTMTVELTEQEIKLVTNALHLFYKEQQSIDYDNATDAKALRNEFGKLIGVQYVGNEEPVYGVDLDSLKEGDRIYNPIAGLLIAMYDDDGTMLFCGKDYAWFGWEIDTFVWELVTDKDNKYNLVTDKWGFRGAGLPLSKEEKERLATL